MKRKIVLGIVLTLLFTGILTLTLDTQPAKVSATITIKDDGSIDPPTAPIDQDGNVYTFTSNINDEIVVKKDNIVIDGAGFTLQGSGGMGINLTGRSYITIKNMKMNGCLILLRSSSNNVISGVNITNVSGYGIILDDSTQNRVFGNNIITSTNCSIYLYMNSDDNIISGNNMTNSLQSVILVSSDDNIFSGNYITNNWDGVTFTASTGNKFFHNSFINSSGRHVRMVGSGQANFWDDGYPSGGNYWSNYTGVDVKRGANQNIGGSDGIGDTDHVIDGNNRDNYPLMTPWTPIRTSFSRANQNYSVTIVSNTTISDTVIDRTGQRVTLSFTSSGQPGERGCVLVIFPMIVDESDIKVEINGTEIPPPQLLINNNGTHFFIYFEFTFSSSYDIVVQFAPPVGGIWIPVDKFSLLAPYIALVSTIIIAISVSVAYIKYRKKQ